MHLRSLKASYFALGLLILCIASFALASPNSDPITTQQDATQSHKEEAATLHASNHQTETVEAPKDSERKLAQESSPAAPAVDVAVPHTALHVEASSIDTKQETKHETTEEKSSESENSADDVSANLNEARTYPKSH